MNNILEYLESSAADYPDKKAFEDDNRSCTFREVMEQAKLVGSGLTDKVLPRSPIPILMEKSVTAVTAFMSIAYAGCFYIMLDIKQPAIRLNHILKTLESKVILTTHGYDKELEGLEYKGEVLYLEELMCAKLNEPELIKRRKQVLDIDPLYCIFTSGSTGIPKGVVVSHKSVIDFIEQFTTLFHITHDDIIGNQAPFDFDVSVKDIYSTLKTGATMQIIPRRMFSIPTQLMDYLCDRNITTLIWAVSALCIITTLNGFNYKIPPNLNKILFSGEVMPIKHLNKWREVYPNAMFVNLYGPTEITCNCTYYIVDREFAPGEVLPIGQVFPNEKVFLLDENNQLISKQNVKGELCVSGSALSLGYFNNKEQTAKSFVQNPLNLYFNEMIYRTGDLAYYNEFGELYFASRKDFQIKHMGQRIELGEIETSMEEIPQINRVCCIFEEISNKIIAFYEGDIDKREIIKYLKTKLPVFMVPNVFRQVEVLPITKNGKIDRESLKKII